jgi:hypothetical protein
MNFPDTEILVNGGLDDSSPSHALRSGDSPACQNMISDLSPGIGNKRGGLVLKGQVIITTGTADSGSTTELIDDALVQATGYWIGALLTITAGTNAGESRIVSAFASATDKITVETAFTSPIDNTSVYKLTFPIYGGLTFSDNVGAQTAIIEVKGSTVSGNFLYKSTDMITFTSLTTGLKSGYKCTFTNMMTYMFISNGYDEVMRFDGTNFRTCAGVSGTADSGTTLTLVDAALTEAASYWNDFHIKITSGTTNFGVVRRIASFNATSHTVTVDEAFPAAITTETYTILGLPKGRYVTTWKGTFNGLVLVIAADSDLNAVYYSEIGNPMGFYDLTTYEPQKIAVEDNTSEITAIIEFQMNLVVGKHNAIYAINSNYEFWQLDTPAGVGIEFHESCQVRDSNLIFWSLDAIYRYNGAYCLKISDRILNLYGTIQKPQKRDLFWIQQSIADWNAGTMGSEQLTTDDGYLAQKGQNTTEDFNAGTPTNVTVGTNCVTDMLRNTTSDVCLYKTVSLSPALTNYDHLPYLVDGVRDNNHYCDFYNARGSDINLIIDLGGTYLLNKMDFKFYRKSRRITIYGLVSGVWVQIYNVAPYWMTPATTQANLTNEWIIEAGFQFNAMFISQFKISLPLSLAGSGTVEGLEGYYFSAYQTGYDADGNIVSQTIDYGTPPTTYGHLAASTDLSNGTAITFYTESSSSSDFSTGNDPAGWVAVADGGLILSLLKRYLRWTAVLTRDTTTAYTPTLYGVYVGATWISQVHHCTPFTMWDLFQASLGISGIMTCYVSTSANGSTGWTDWAQVAPGDIIPGSPSLSYIKIKVELDKTVYTQVPALSAFYVRWFSSSQSVIPTSTITSIFFNGRTLFSCLEGGAEDSATISWNNMVLALMGKDIRNRVDWIPWRGLTIGAMFTFQQSLYFGSSYPDGKIWVYDDTVRSDDGVAIDAFWESEIAPTNFRFWTVFHHLFPIYQAVSAPWKLYASFYSDDPATITIGTATGGSSTTLIDTSRTEVSDFWIGALLTITGGTGIGQSRIVTDYDKTTGVITVAAWTTAPVAGSTYMITNPGYEEIDVSKLKGRDKIRLNMSGYKLRIRFFNNNIGEGMTTQGGRISYEQKGE